MRKRYVALAVVVLALAGAGVGSSVASGDSGATTTHFTASYTDPVFGPVVCAGERIVKTSPKAFVKDSEDCTLLNGYPAGTYSCAEFGGWASDFDGSVATQDCTEVITDNGDGTSNNHIVAYY